MAAIKDLNATVALNPADTYYTKSWDLRRTQSSSDETSTDAGSSTPSDYRIEKQSLPRSTASHSSITSPTEKHIDDLVLQSTQHGRRESKLNKARVDALYNLDTTSVSTRGVVRRSLGKKPEMWVRVLIYWLTLLGGLCGSVNNIWNVLMLLRRLDMAKMMKGVVRF